VLYLQNGLIPCQPERVFNGIRYKCVSYNGKVFEQVIATFTHNIIMNGWHLHKERQLCSQLHSPLNTFTWDVLLGGVVVDLTGYHRYASLYCADDKNDQQIDAW